MAFAAEVLTLFPPMVDGYAKESVLGKAMEKGLVEVRSPTCATSPPASTTSPTTRPTAAARAW